MRRIGTAVSLAGVLGVGVCLSFNEFVSRTGVVDGDDLFVVNAKREASVQKLVDSGKVAEGEVVVEFRPPSIEGQLAVLDNQLKEGQARIQALHARALPVDQILLQKQGQLRAEIDQQRYFRFDLQKSAREFERDHLALLTTWAKEKSQLEADLSTAKKALEVNRAQIEVAKTQLARATDMRARAIGTVTAVEDRSVNTLNYGLERGKHQVLVYETERRIALLDERYTKSNKAFLTQLAVINKEEPTVVTRIDEVGKALSLIEKAIVEDQNRAKTLTEREIEAGEHQLAAIGAEREKALEGTHVKAPFSGSVVYRHPSPGLAPENTPILAVSAGTGFTAQVWMPQSEVTEIERAGDVQFALENAVLKKYFVGQFKRAEAAPYEPNRVIAHFDAKLPVEAISMLGNVNNPIRVRLHWRPSLSSNQAFRLSTVLVLVGALAMLGGSIGFARRPHSPEQDHGSRPAFKIVDGDTKAA